MNILSGVCNQLNITHALVNGNRHLRPLMARCPLTIVCFWSTLISLRIFSFFISLHVSTFSSSSSSCVACTTRGA